MNTSNRIEITSPYEPLFALAADISRWPEILAHYRWVTILERKDGQVKAEMAARHRGVPLWWKTIQRPKPSERRIEFTHIGGITKGMEVQWIFEHIGESANVPTWAVHIHHQFSPHWPALLGPWFAEAIIGKCFVSAVANKTLDRMKEIVEKNRQD